MKRFLQLIAISSLFAVFAAFALTVDEAKNQGAIGETLSGYLAVVDDTNTAAIKLVDEINRARETKYTEIANKNNLQTRDVAKIAGQKLVERAETGEYVRGINGQWLKKK